MKGGSLIGEQFDRLLLAVPRIRPKDSAEWQRYLTGFGCPGCGFRNPLPYRGKRIRPLPLTCPAGGPVPYQGF